MRSHMLPMIIKRYDSIEGANRKIFECVGSLNRDEFFSIPPRTIRIHRIESRQDGDKWLTFIHIEYREDWTLRVWKPLRLPLWKRILNALRLRCYAEQESWFVYEIYEPKDWSILGITEDDIDYPLLKWYEAMTKGKAKP